MIKSLSKNLPRKTLNELYKLDYGDVIYHIPHNQCDFGQEISPNNHRGKLQSVRYSAGLALTGAWRGTSRKKLYEEFGWESLNLRRWSRRLILSYKFVNNITPDYTRYPIPKLQQGVYSIRGPDIIGQINTKTMSFKNSFYPHCLSEWNKLDPDTRSSPSLSIFKTKLLKYIRPAPKLIYNIHNPECLAILT